MGVFDDNPMRKVDLREDNEPVSAMHNMTSDNVSRVETKTEEMQRNPDYDLEEGIVYASVSLYKKGLTADQIMNKLREDGGGAFSNGFARERGMEKGEVRDKVENIQKRDIEDAIKRLQEKTVLTLRDREGRVRPFLYEREF